MNKEQKHPLDGLGFGLAFALVIVAFGLMMWLADSSDNNSTSTPTAEIDVPVGVKGVEGVEYNTIEEWREDVIEEVNRMRECYEHYPLTENEQLNESAQAKAEALEEVGVFGHTLPDGTEFLEFIEDAGHYRQYLGENLACGFPHPEATVLAWLYSRGHRRVMLADDYDSVGVGIAPFVYKEGVREGKKCGLTAVLHVSGGPIFSKRASYYGPLFEDLE